MSTDERAQTVFLSAEIHFILPQGLTMPYRDIEVLRSCVEDFIQWEMNEYIRNKTGVLCYYGPSLMEMVNAEKKESFY